MQNSMKVARSKSAKERTGSEKMRLNIRIRRLSKADLAKKISPGCN